MGLDMNIDGNEIFVNGNVDLRAINLKTLPHPGFPTDMQPQFKIKNIQNNGCFLFLIYILSILAFNFLNLYSIPEYPLSI